MTVTSVAYAETFRQLRKRPAKPEEERKREKTGERETDFEIDPAPKTATASRAYFFKNLFRIDRFNLRKIKAWFQHTFVMNLLLFFICLSCKIDD